jgi:hypothetical protein
MERPTGDEIVKANLPLDEVYRKWEAWLEKYQLVDWALPLLDFLYTMQGIILPAIWMLEPFMPMQDIAPLEQALANPDILLRLQDQLAEKEVSAR